MVAAAAAAAVLASCTPQPGLGNAAFISGGALQTLQLGTCVRRTLVPRGAAGPLAWSHDGKWIAFGSGKVVSVDGGRVLQPVGPVARWSWSPTSDTLAGTTLGGALVEGRPGGAPVVREPRGWGALNVVWQPDGRGLAVGRARFTGAPSPSGRQQIVWLERGEKPVTIYTTPPHELAPPLVVGFGGGFGHLFFQPDMQNSASIAADGLPLVPLPPARGTAHMSPALVMLPQPGFFAPCGKAIVVVAGGDRDTTTNKRLVVVRFDPASGVFRARGVSRDPSRAWVSPSCSPDRTEIAAAAGPDRADASLVHPGRAVWLLSLDGRAKRQLTHPPRGWSDESPLWAANGKAVLFTRTRAARGLLYAARLDGTLVGPLARLRGNALSVGYALWPVAAHASENLATLGCTPQPGLGVVSYLRGVTRHRANLGTCRDTIVRRNARPPSTAAHVHSPDHRFTASIRVSGRLRTLRNTIWVTDARTGRSRPVYSAKTCCATRSLVSPGPIELLHWSGDSRFVFFAIDPGGSGSIAADGLILRVVPAAGGAAHRLPVMLPYPNYMTWCGGRLVFTAGNDRVAIHHKQLDVAGTPDWVARPLVRAAGRSWGAVTCAPDRRSIVAQSQREGDDANFYATRWQLWRVGLDGSQMRLTSPPAHHADESPRFSRDGRTILFVRSRRGDGVLYALLDGALAGPLLSLGHSDGYYGHQDWWSTMSWSLGYSR